MVRRVMKKPQSKKPFLGGIKSIATLSGRFLRMVQPNVKKDLVHDKAKLKWYQAQLRKASPDTEPELKVEILRLEKKIAALERVAKAAQSPAARKAAA